MNIDRVNILIEEVKIIQDVIKRMASNSFNVKTWTITLIVATLLFKGNSNSTFIAFIPLFAFWFLDSYYLRQERLFRKLHNYIVKYRLNDDNNLFDMNIIKFSSDVQSTLRIMFSISTLPFYGSIFIKVLRYCLF
jgi:hypothetical protein